MFMIFFQDSVQLQKKVWETSALGLALWNRQEVYETGKKHESFLFSRGPNTNFRLGGGSLFLLNAPTVVVLQYQNVLYPG